MKNTQSNSALALLACRYARRDELACVSSEVFINIYIRAAAAVATTFYSSKSRQRLGLGGFASLATAVLIITIFCPSIIMFLLVLRSQMRNIQIWIIIWWTERRKKPHNFWTICREKKVIVGLTTAPLIEYSIENWQISNLLKDKTNPHQPEYWSPFRYKSS